MKAALFEVDAFTGPGLAGNRAAVVVIDTWLPDEVLQATAARVALSETAWLVADVAGRYELRWFTPTTEVDLCGHATLAAAHVVFVHLEPGRAEVSFKTRSGPLGVGREKDLLALDFPSRLPLAASPPPELEEAMGIAPVETLATPRDWLLVYRTEEDVRVLAPDLDVLRTFDRPGVIVTAPVAGGAAGRDYDFVSRFFAPALGVDEDPVTGSAHCTLAPFWAKRLGRPRLRARQLSARGGELFCEDRGERVSIAGRVEPFLEGTIEL